MKFLKSATVQWQLQPGDLGPGASLRHECALCPTLKIVIAACCGKSRLYIRIGSMSMSRAHALRCLLMYRV